MADRHFVLLGRTGVGKSSFVNLTLGVKLAPISHYESCTKVVKHYSKTSKWGSVCLIDTPGLAEGGESLDHEYLRLIKQDKDLPEKFHILYFSPLIETRFRPEEKLSLRRVYQWFPASFDSIWLILTFAASVENRRRQEACDKRIQDIRNYIGTFAVGFCGFDRVGLVDNVNSSWTDDGISADQFLQK
jgi:GTP-binding protein EngB required for normal cell division